MWVKKRVIELIYEKAQELDCKVVSLAIEPEHIHLFLNCSPDLAPKQIMHRIKGYSSHILRSFKGTFIRTVNLAHATLHLLN